MGWMDTYHFHEAMDKIILLVVIQVIVESCIAGGRVNHLEPVVTMLAVGEAGWSGIMF